MSYGVGPSPWGADLWGGVLGQVVSGPPPPVPDVTPPAMPTGLDATPGDNSIALVWDANTEPDLAGYFVYREEKVGGVFQPALRFSSSVASYDDDTAVNGHTYRYRISAFDTAPSPGPNESARTAYTAELTPSGPPPADTPPAAPTNLVAAAGNSLVSLDWNDNGEADLDHYKVYRETLIGGSWVAETLLSGNVPDSAFIDSLAVNGSTYRYRVSAVDTPANQESTKSAYSNQVTPVASVPATPGIQVFVGGVERTGALITESLSVSWELGNRCEASFQLFDVTRQMHFRAGEQVRITRDGPTIFAGVVHDVQENILDGSEDLFLEIGCVDYSALADRHIVAAKIAFPGQTLFDVVNAIVVTYSGDIGETLFDAGITIQGTIEPGIKLGPLTFNYQTAKECFDDLAELTGTFWYIDFNKFLWFRSNLQIKAPFDLDASTFGRYRGLRVERSLERYRNVQYLRAGKDVSDVRVERFRGDGDTRSFTLALPLAETPIIQVDTGGGPVTKSVGIQQKEKDKDWYYTIDSNTVSQDGDGTVLTSSHTVIVTYRGFFRIILQGRDEAEIVTRRGVEGGVGTYTHVEEDEKINDDDLAEEKLSALLRRFAFIPNTAGYQSDQNGFMPGQVQKVNLPGHELAGEYLITKVDFGIVGQIGGVEKYSYTIQITDGEFVGGWTDFFLRLASKGRALVLRENESLQLLRELQSPIGITDTLSLVDALGTYKLDLTTMHTGGVSRTGGYRQVAAEDPAQGVPWGPMTGFPLAFSLS